MQALTSPVFRSIALGGLLLATTAAMVKPEPHMHRMRLHAPRHCGEFYLTAWSNGDVRLPAGNEGHTLTFRTRAHLNDGCHWQSTETLTPVTATRYAYRYEERLLSCEPDAVPYVETPRVGYVDVLE